MHFQWRPMRDEDLDAVLHVAGVVHPALPESKAVFAERRSLFPQGCIVLASGASIEGYAVSHPIRRFQPPPLDTMLGKLAADANDYYIHDFAVMPARRGEGLAAAGVNALLEVARSYETASLISVYETADFWSRFGFAPADRDMGDRLGPYGARAVYMLRKSLGHGKRQKTK